MKDADRFINFSVRYVTEAGLKANNRKNVETALPAGTQLLVPDRTTHPEEWVGIPKDRVPIRILKDSEPYFATVEAFWANTSEGPNGASV